MTAALLAIAPPLAHGASQDTQAALVYDVRGTWRASSADAPLQPMASVSAGDRIAPGPHPKAGDKISISLFDGTSVTLGCTADDRCDAPYLVPDTRPPTPSLIERMGRVLAQLGAPDVDRVMTPAVRGDGPQDAVVAQTDGRLDLGPALHGVGPGRYQAELRPWTGAEPSTTRRTLRVTVQESGGVLTMGAADAPGPYQLTLVDPTGALAGQAIILVAPPAEFDRLRNGFDRAKRMTASWPQTAGQAAVRRFLQYYLLALGRDPSLAANAP